MNIFWKVYSRGVGVLESVGQVTINRPNFFLPNLNTSLRYACCGLSPIIDYFFQPLWQGYDFFY